MERKKTTTQTLNLLLYELQRSFIPILIFGTQITPFYSLKYVNMVNTYSN